MIERRSRDFNQPDQPVIVIEGKRDQRLGSIATPRAVRDPAPMIAGSSCGWRGEYD